MKGRRAHIILTGLLFTLMFIVVGGNSARGQRVYADAQTPSGTPLLTNVSNPTQAVLTPTTDFSTLNLTLSALGLVQCSQNLQFTGAVKPTPGTPITVKIGANSSLLNVADAVTVQPTNNSANVGTPYSSNALLGLLYLNGTDFEATLPAPNTTYDGVKLTVSSTLGITVTGRYYYAFFITSPTVSPQTICNNSPVTLTVSPAQSGYTYNWYSTSTGGTALQSSTSASFTPSPNLTATTTYYVEAVETATGTSYYSGRTAVTVIVNNPPTTATTGANQNLCSTTTTLTGNTPTAGTGAWTKISGPGTPTFVSASNPTTTVNGLTTGTYVFRWTISNSPCTASTSDITVVVGAPVTASNAGTAQNLCAATGTTMAANAPIVGTGTWSQDSGPSTAVFTSPNLNNTAVTGLVTGDYVFRWTISSGSCPTSASTVNVKITANPTTADAGTDQNLCNVTTATLAGNTAIVGTGTWTRISGPNTPTITNSAANNSTLTGMIPGTYVYRWTIANVPCTASFDEVSITISAAPTTANAGANQLLCSATSTTLAGNSPTVGTGAWSRISGPNTPVITTPAANNSTVTGMISGTYVFRWTISNGSCTASTSDVTIVVSTTPAITLGTAPSACKEITSSTMIYTGTTGSPVTYSITWGASALTAGFTNVSNASLPSSPISLTVPGTGAVASYSGSITVKNADGCESASVPFTFTIHPKPAAPHIITQ